jgi:hypothetical protein
MGTITESRLAFWLGMIGGGLIAIGGLGSIFSGFVDLALGRVGGAMDATSTGFVLVVVGGLAMLLAYLARREWSSRPLTGGLALVLLALVGWAFLGLAGAALPLVGGLLVFVSGVLLAVEPSRSHLAEAVAA